MITDIGELLVAYRNRKNSEFLDVKCCADGKVEWDKNSIRLKRKSGKRTYFHIVYWCEIKNLTKKQFKAKFEMHPRWDKMFEH